MINPGTAHWCPTRESALHDNARVNALRLSLLVTPATTEIPDPLELGPLLCAYQLQLLYHAACIHIPFVSRACKRVMLRTPR